MFTVTRVTNVAPRTPGKADQNRPQRDNPMKAKTREDYSQKQRKERAQAILDNYQLLMDYAVANGKTRTYFRKVALGIPTEPIIKHWFSDIV
ncbi:hypothetical protein A1O3_10341 [Capronia epimyces CBS 606.96]|uniref:Uncharacterized protein n=1 Tax=Capronia epimyces CBS 606.96 TaxID=1182542 RepID=W9XAA9_9EURO|nr:uncharacterized protein A1O3_10341 [Capronia epimyces CBS 606.96]EXJ77183.1 hypothetical protein A1O3_10341 [Capronia epimyces CBS 606.96]